MSRSLEPHPNGWEGNEVVMIFDGETGNAVGAFDFTTAELRRLADELDGRASVTMEPSPFAMLANG